MTGNLKFQNALNKIPQAVPPIWFMRQAGRYHHHYQALRKQHSFEELCKIPELAAEVAWGPIQDFDFDVAILFSDILFPLEALGMGLKYTDEGPRLSFQLDHDSVKKLKPANESCEFLNFQGQAMGLTRKKLPANKSLIGFVGGIWTLFVYACEGGHAGSLTKAKSQIDLFSQFAEAMYTLHVYTIQKQLDAGAEVVHIFDTAAGELSPALFQQHVVPTLQKLARKFPNQLGYYSKGTQSAFLSAELVSAPWAGFGFDHRWDLPEFLKNSRTKLQVPGFIQGNFDQALLHCSPEDLKKYLDAYISTWKDLTIEERAGWVSGLGHGILPKTPEANVHTFVSTIRKSFGET